MFVEKRLYFLYFPQPGLMLRFRYLPNDNFLLAVLELFPMWELERTHRIDPVIEKAVANKVAGGRFRSISRQVFRLDAEPCGLSPFFILCHLLIRFSSASSSLLTLYLPISAPDISASNPHRILPPTLLGFPTLIL